MTNFVIHDLPRIYVGGEEMMVARFTDVHDLKVYGGLGKCTRGYARVKDRWRMVWIYMTINAINNNELDRNKLLVSKYSYDTEDQLRNKSGYTFLESEHIYDVVGDIDQEGYNRILTDKIGMYKKF